MGRTSSGSLAIVRGAALRSSGCADAGRLPSRRALAGELPPRRSGRDREQQLNGLLEGAMDAVELDSALHVHLTGRSLNGERALGG
jgi:hypothetical protein